MESYLDIIDGTNLESVEEIEGVLNRMVKELTDSKMDKYITFNVVEGVEYLLGTAALELLDDELGAQDLTEQVEHIKVLCEARVAVK